MKRLGKIWPLVLAVLVLGIAGGVALAQSTQNFTIQSFTADYYLDRNAAKTSTLHTVENIQAEFPSYDQNHGILRSIPQTFQGHTVSLQIDSVTDANRTPIHYTTSVDSDNLVLKIGDANTYVHGLTTYIITYDAKNVVSLLDTGDEFYWDVNGTQWPQTFSRVVANIHVSSKIADNLDGQRACYSGVINSKDTSQCTIGQPVSDNVGQLIVSQAGPLGAYEGLTFDVGFKSGTFVLGPEIAQAQKAAYYRYGAYVAAILALPAATAAFMYSRWLRFGRDPKGRGVIIPEYEPPKGLNALTSDFIYKENLDNKAITALVIELAIRKYLAIYEFKEAKTLRKDKTGYKLRLLADPATLSVEEKQVINMFFGGANTPGAEVNLSDLKNDLSSDVSRLKKQLGTSLTSLGYFKNDPTKANKIFYTIGGIAAFGAFYLAGVFWPIGISLTLSGVIMLLFARYLPARSEKGVEVRDQMLGLRDYIKLAEADRLKFLQSTEGAEKITEASLKPSDPQFKVKLFEKLLPYAMLFGLEKSWAKEFENIYTQPPDWYHGNWASFNTGYLIGSLGNFNTVSASTFSPPSSSGSSGFGGGGFSGGGGGGGGGGGW